MKSFFQRTVASGSLHENPINLKLPNTRALQSTTAFKCTLNLEEFTTNLGLQEKSESRYKPDHYLKEPHGPTGSEFQIAAFEPEVEIPE